MEEMRQLKPLVPCGAVGFVALAVFVPFQGCLRHAQEPRFSPPPASTVREPEKTTADLLVIGQTWHSGLQIESALGEEGNTFALALTTARVNYPPTLPPLLSTDFTVKLISKDGRSLPVLERPPHLVVNEFGSLARTGHLLYRFGPRGRFKIADLDNYIKNQKEHHRVRSFREEYVAFLNKHGLKYDSQNVWG